MANPTALRALLFGFAFLFLSAGIACGAPQFQSASFWQIPNTQVQNCANESMTASAQSLLISARLAYYSPSSLAFCSNEPRSPSRAMQLPADLPPKQPSPVNVRGQPKPPSFEHPFWDRENDLLFAAVGASRTLDYFSTLNFRRRGRNEALLSNDIVDNHAAFASIEAAATAASIGVSYLFHRYHHHRLERWTSIVHASLATSGAARNYCLQTAHP